MVDTQRKSYLLMFQVTSKVTCYPSFQYSRVHQDNHLMTNECSTTSPTLHRSELLPTAQNTMSNALLEGKVVKLPNVNKRI